MGLAIIGTMTRPLLVVLSIMPRSVFAGVFFVVGWGSIETNDILQRFVWLLREPRFIQPSDPLLTIRRSRIGLYLFWQVLGVLSTVAISQTIAAIGFPVLIIALIPLRWKMLPKMFTARELGVLDALTADNEVVLASLGGRPEMPELRDEDQNGNAEKGRPADGVRRRRSSLHR
jgi:boron transporter